MNCSQHLLICLGLFLNILEDVVQKLQHVEPSELKHRDHLLVGDWDSHRECHISPDWSLIYTVDKELELGVCLSSANS
jgi:mRNA interferase YafQ